MKLGKFELDEIYIGDCRDLIKDLPNNSIDMCITSPPYWGLRDYGEETKIIWDGDEKCEHNWNSYIKKQHSGRIDQIDSKDTVYSHHENIPDKNIELAFCSKCGAWKGQLGLEPDFNLYIKHLCDIFDEVKRVLKNEGTCWVNIGDTYGGSGSASGHTEYTKNLGYTTSKMGATKGHTKNIMAKCLIMIPFRFAIEMVNRGWILRNVIIWHKPGCMPSSAKDRFTVDFEYLFFFSKNKKYYFEQQFEPWIDKNIHDIKRAIYGHKEYKGKYKSEKKGKFSFGESKIVGDPLRGRNKRTVWSINTKPFKEAHFAVFPPKLIETPIRAGCPEFICKKCGKAREKIFDKKLKDNIYKPRINEKYSAGSEFMSNKTTLRCETETKEKGYTDCGCNAGFEAGIVLDPFIGSGTTGKVAIKQRKHFIGFEINPKYVLDIADKRLENIQVRLL